MRTGSSINIFSRDICYQCYQLSTSSAFICGFTQNFEQVYAFYKMLNSIVLIQFRLKFHWIPPENVRKPMVFWRFQGVQKWNIGLKWVNRQVKIQKKTLDWYIAQVTGPAWNSYNKIITIHILILSFIWYKIPCLTFNMLSQRGKKDYLHLLELVFHQPGK